MYLEISIKVTRNLLCQLAAWFAIGNKMVKLQKRLTTTKWNFSLLQHLELKAVACGKDERNKPNPSHNPNVTYSHF